MKRSDKVGQDHKGEIVDTTERKIELFFSRLIKGKGAVIKTSFPSIVALSVGTL